MAGTQWLLEIALIGLLAATLFHALRLERALGVVRRDRAELETLVRSFNDSTRQAESGVEKLRSAADGVGRHISRQIEAATALKDDLGHLVERGERLADQMDAPARRAPTPEPEMAALAGPRMRSQAERDLLRALRVTR